MAKITRDEMIDVILDEVTGKMGYISNHTLKAILDIIEKEYDERPSYFD